MEREEITSIQTLSEMDDNGIHGICRLAVGQADVCLSAKNASSFWKMTNRILNKTIKRFFSKNVDVNYPFSHTYVQKELANVYETNTYHLIFFELEQKPNYCLFLQISSN